MSQDFKSLKVTRQFVDALRDMGVENPTDIQEKALPPALAGQDVLGVAQTGSGKTLAYLIPLAMRVKFASGIHPRALVLSPSKELVVQIYQTAKALSANTDLRCVALYGGVGRKNQIAELQEGCDILVSTPGRFLDLYTLGHIHTRTIKILVLDEADRLMDMGFMPQLRRMLEILPVKRQNLLLSATFPERVEALAAEFLEFPVRVFGRNPQKPVAKLKQYWYPVPNFRSKLSLLIDMLDDPEMDKVMVFCRTKDTAERLSRFLTRQDVGGVGVLHANKAQNTRIHALDAFRDGHLRILVTTDVSARGIDVDYVTHVVNFELPKNAEDYLHRIGRTARIRRDGQAISFVGDMETDMIDQLEKTLKTKIEALPWPDYLEPSEDLPGEKRQRLIDQDNRRKAMDPTYGGAFHTKKKKRGASKNRKKR